MPTIPKATKAAATRWLEAHVGQTIWTDQSTKTAYDTRTWNPGPRTLSKKGSQFQLNDSFITKLDSSVEVTYLSDTSLTICIRYDNYMQVTHYTDFDPS